MPSEKPSKNSASVVPLFGLMSTPATGPNDHKYPSLWTGDPFFTHGGRKLTQRHSTNTPGMNWYQDFDVYPRTVMGPHGVAGVVVVVPVGIGVWHMICCAGVHGDVVVPTAARPAARKPLPPKYLHAADLRSTP
jgi:hypothetical protein